MDYLIMNRKKIPVYAKNLYTTILLSPALSQDIQLDILTLKDKTNNNYLGKYFSLLTK